MTAISTEERLPGLRHFDIKITEKNLDHSAKMLIKHIKKDWDAAQLHRKDFNAGITNRLVGYYLEEGGFKTSTTYGEYGRSDIVLLRIYGAKTELLIDRAQELRNFLLMHDQKLAPELYCTFSNGFCYGFVEGRILVEEDFKDQAMINRCAQLLARLHTLKLTNDYLKYHPNEPYLFKRLQRYVQLIPSKFPSDEKQKRFEELLPSKEQLKSEVEEIKAAVDKSTDLKVTFCHNDLLRENLVYNDTEDIVKCIDYEYGSPNYSAYDIANNFNEFAGVEKVDYNLYPSKDVQFSYIATYLDEMRKIEGNPSDVSDKEIHNWYVHINQLALASHLFWGVWAIIQAFYSEIDFDYIGYAKIRFDEYYRRKDEFLSLKEEI